MVPGLMAGQPREAEPVPVCLAPGHNLSIIQDRPPVQPSPNQTCSLSRPLWFPEAVSRPLSFQAFSLPAAVSCHLLCPRSSRLACPQCCLRGVRDTVTGGLDAGIVPQKLPPCPLVAAPASPTVNQFLSVHPGPPPVLLPSL